MNTEENIKKIEYRIAQLENAFLYDIELAAKVRTVILLETSNEIIAQLDAKTQSIAKLEAKVEALELCLNLEKKKLFWTRIEAGFAAGGVVGLLLLLLRL